MGDRAGGRIALAVLGLVVAACGEPPPAGTPAVAPSGEPGTADAASRSAGTVTGRLVVPPAAAGQKFEVYLLNDEVDRLAAEVKGDTYSFSDVPQGSYQLVALTKDRLHSSLNKRVVVGPSPPPPIPLELRPTGTLEVFGRGIKRVRLIDEHGEPEGWIVGAQITSGAYDVEFDREDGTSGRAKVEIRGGEKASVELR